MSARPETASTSSKCTRLFFPRDDAPAVDCCGGTLRVAEGSVPLPLIEVVMKGEPEGTGAGTLGRSELGMGVSPCGMPIEPPTDEVAPPLRC